MPPLPFCHPPMSANASTDAQVDDKKLLSITFGNNSIFNIGIRKNLSAFFHYRNPIKSCQLMSL